MCASFSIFFFFLLAILQILRAVGQRVLISPSVDLNEVAAATDGFSGADLQALVYNAHLEVIHASLPSTLDKQMTAYEDEHLIQFISFGGSKATSVVSKAEESALQRRVSL
jgi:peroxin-1